MSTKKSVDHHTIQAGEGRRTIPSRTEESFDPLVFVADKRSPLGIDGGEARQRLNGLPEPF
jgi:hypothetical protein